MLKRGIGKVLTIAYCDDEKTQLQMIDIWMREELEALNIEYDIECYTSGTALLKDYERKEQSFDLILLDIDMPDMDGITVVGHLREIDEEVTVIFLSNMVDKVYDAFGYNVFKFVRKSEGESGFKKAFKECIKQVDLRRNTYVFHTSEGIMKLRENEIVYFETVMRAFYMQTTKGHYKIRVLKFEQILDSLNNHTYFSMPNRSCLVNMRYVKTINKKGEVVLMYGNKEEHMTLSRQKRKEFYDKFISYIKLR